MQTTQQALYALCEKLFPICRSLTGDGVRETLQIIKSHLPDLTIHEVPTGTHAFDWTVPKEWNIQDAFIIDPQGNKIIDFKDSNLHVVGYSVPVNRAISLEDLQPHLYSLPEQPDAIPYITSYYHETWGFCLRDSLRKCLQPGTYHAVIDSQLEAGHLTYAELILPGQTEQEIFLSTYVCHPSTANNELSGPVVTTFLAKWLSTLPKRKYTYRIIFIPETIGSILYLSRHLTAMKKNIIAGFNVTCVGDEGPFSYLPSRYGDTLADRVACHILTHTDPGFVRYRYLDRGSDERQYCSPGVDLPVASIMRSKHGEYPEYHTSLDNLGFISPKGLLDSFQAYQHCLTALEKNEIYRVTMLCEPQLSKRSLYPTTSTRQSRALVRDMMNFLAYCDGDNDLVAIAERIEVPVWLLYDIVEKLSHTNLIEIYSA